ncbi:enoyl-CoA hydratase/isomerase family protein [Actinomadura chibensis]|uniref:Enoyl-CoA hydratase/isomerase family protein n=1 Tax=Actinomadura chibensis TaxID=392828 RepID=A0A5D0NVF0_9ACTN|nr:enoyl-CoA hydratase/isomerase family protein [Actinomadura chibensis]TYB48222.1 enoyl-CoA hydratase/isomerase family protein [Actinomadura chibensis]
MIETESRGDVVELTLDRPPANAWTRDGVAELGAAVDRIIGSPETRAVVVRARGRLFSAGGDVREMVEVLRRPDPAPALDRFSTEIQSAFERFAKIPCPTIAVLEGAATGGGLELALACDLRIAARGALLGLPEAGIGLVPAGGGTQRLTRLVGEGHALRLMMLAELVDADAALSMGLVQWVEDRRHIDARVAQVVGALRRASGDAQREIKKCVGATTVADGLAQERASQALLHRTDGTIARLRAFTRRK